MQSRDWKNMLVHFRLQEQKNNKNKNKKNACGFHITSIPYSIFHIPSIHQSSILHSFHIPYSILHPSKKKPKTKNKKNACGLHPLQSIYGFHIITNKQTNKTKSNKVIKMFDNIIRI